MADESTSSLGGYLRARREQADPAGAELPGYTRRRTPGLRREELALLAGISVHYYARLEQGRDHHPSPQVLDAIARALDLDEEATSHLHRLAAPAPPRRPGRRAERCHPDLEALVGRWDREAVVVVGRYRDVLVANEAAGLLNPGYAPGRNLLRDILLDESIRARFADWEDVVSDGVAALRASAGADPDDARLTELVGELSVKSDAFRRIWARHEVRQKTTGAKRFCSPVVGELCLRYTTFQVNAAPDQQLFVFFPAAGSVDEQAWASVLATRAAGPRLVG